MKKILVGLLVITQVGLNCFSLYKISFPEEKVTGYLGKVDVVPERSYSGIKIVINFSPHLFLVKIVELCCKVPQLPFSNEDGNKRIPTKDMVFSVVSGDYYSGSVIRNLIRGIATTTTIFYLYATSFQLVFSKYKFLWLMWLFFLYLFKLVFCCYIPRGDILSIGLSNCVFGHKKTLTVSRETVRVFYLYELGGWL